ncbi:MAG: hypothetical protein IPI34_04845 [bacterium]|nr:hypothetical protein [bacterium]
MDGSGRIHVSTDGGLTFGVVPNYTGATMGGISGLATHPANPAVAYVLFSLRAGPRSLRTTDLDRPGTTSRASRAPAPAPTASPRRGGVRPAGAFDDRPPWAGTEIGLVESLDGGATWDLADNGLPSGDLVDDRGRGRGRDRQPRAAASGAQSSLAGRGQDLQNRSSTPLPGPRRPAERRPEPAIRLRDSTQVFVDGASGAPPCAGQRLSAGRLVQRPCGRRPAPAFRPRLPRRRRLRLGDARSSRSSWHAPPLSAYTNSFSTSATSVGDGFTIGASPASAAARPALPARLPRQRGLTAMLAVPIVVTQSNAYVSFDEVVLIEPGEAGSVYGDGDFWDYVILEGSKDGIAWVPIADGYDSRRDAAWVTAWNSGTPGSSSLLRPHRSSCTTPSPARHDPAALAVSRRRRQPGAGSWTTCRPGRQPDRRGRRHAGPRRVLAQNAPYPFNPSTVIRFSLPQAGPVSLRIYDVRGRQVRSLVEGNREAGAHSVVWDGRDDRGGNASGVRVPAAGGREVAAAQHDARQVSRLSPRPRGRPAASRTVPAASRGTP